jgi:type IV pilus assembly protein PilN
MPDPKKPNKKNNSSVINFVGKVLSQNEQTLGLIINKQAIQCCLLSYKNNTWIMEKYFFTEFKKTENETNVLSQSQFIVEQLKSFISQYNIKTKNIVFALPTENCSMTTVQIPKMELADLETAVSTGIFWEQYENLPKDLENYNIGYQVISVNDEAAMMELAVVYTDKKNIEPYLDILQTCGLNPIIIDSAAIAQLNSLLITYGKEVFENSVAFLNYNKSESYITAASNKGIHVVSLNINEADKVLLETVQDVGDMSTGFWDEIFERLASQIKNSLVEFETRYEAPPVQTIYISIHQQKPENFILGLEKQLTDVKIQLFNIEQALQFRAAAAHNYSQLPNKSLISEVVGLAIRKLNPFNLQENNFAKFNFNLLANVSETKIKQKFSLLSRACSSLIFITLIGFGGHIAISKIPTIYQMQKIVTQHPTNNLTNANNNTQYNDLIKNINLFGSNKLTSSAFYRDLENLVPTNIRITNYEVTEKKKVKIEGVSADDASIIVFINNLNHNPLVENAKIEKIVEYSQSPVTTSNQANRSLTPAPQLNNLQNPTNTNPLNQPATKLNVRTPKEIIKKQFVITLTLLPVKNEKFNDDDKIAELVPAKAVTSAARPINQPLTNTNTQRPTATAPKPLK